jgi:hypothetical protein
VHLLDFSRPHRRLRLRIPDHWFDLRAAERLDAPGLVDRVDGHQRAFAALLPGIGERAGDRMEHADPDRLGLCQRGRRQAESAGSGGNAGRGGLEDVSACVLHVRFPSKERMIGAR